MNPKLAAMLVVALTSTAPALAQAPAPAPFPRTPAGQAAQLGDQRTQLGTIWYDWQFEVRLGDLAAAKGTSEELKSFGRKVADDNRQFGSRLTKLLSDRGIDPASLPQPPEADRKRVEQEIVQMATRAGEDFDRELVGFMLRNGTAYVDGLKHARDATPGSDAELKKLLDDAEDAEEAHLTAARQLESRRVQARTPAR